MRNELPKKWKAFKLEDFLVFQKKSKRKAGDGQEIGKYNFFTSSQVKVKRFDIADYTQESIVLGTGGLPSVHYAKNFATNADTLILCQNKKEVDCK